MRQCSLLIVHVDGPEVADRKALQRAGFLVEQTRQWPGDEVERFQVLLVEVSSVTRAPMLAARLRGKRGIARRVLIACVPEATRRERRAAMDCGFDAVLEHSCTPRQQLASILTCLRTRPEYRCALPRGRRAA